jgi:hypothetical protein
VRTSQNWAKLPLYQGPELLVKSKKETVVEYICRVSDITGVSHDELFQRWQLANEWDD